MIFFVGLKMEYLWPIIVASFWGPMLLHLKNQMKSLKPFHLFAKIFLFRTHHLQISTTELTLNCRCGRRSSGCWCCLHRFHDRNNPFPNLDHHSCQEFQERNRGWGKWIRNSNSEFKYARIQGIAHSSRHWIGNCLSVWF